MDIFPEAFVNLFMTLHAGFITGEITFLLTTVSIEGKE
jgi:hypothetical protein